jgi:TIR domain-containing protein
MRTAAMSSHPGERYDFFLSRRGSVATIAQEVEGILAEKGYSVLTQDYDIPLASSFIEKMHEGVINSRDLIVLFTDDYLRSPFTRKEFTSFEADRAKTTEERHIIILRCEDVPLRGCSRTMFTRTLLASRTPTNASDGSLPLRSANLKQRHHRHDRSSECRRVSRASRVAMNSCKSSTPS